MEFCRVAFVLCQLVLRVLLIQLQHVTVTADLCQNRGRADAGAGGISLDHRLGREEQIFGRAVAVHKNEVWHDVQPLHGLPHPTHGGVEDVVAVNDLRPHKNDLVGQSFFHDFIKKGFPLFLSQLFGVVDAIHRIFRVENAGRHTDRAAQWSPSGFIDACKTAVPRPDGGVVLIQWR